jgi:release factor glutamine methyltransferase
MKVAPANTVDQLLDQGEARLKKHKVEFPDTSVLWLLAHVLGVEDPDELDELGDETVEPDAAQRFWALVERREQHEPYPYIIGVTDFRDELMEIQHGVFLPRFQSEELCDEIEEWVEERAVPRDSWRIADLGAGCGALGVSLAMGPIQPDQVVCVDIDPLALELIRSNAVRHGVADRVRPLAADWLSAFRPEPCFDIICAVPPYLNPGDEEFLTEESLKWEPLKTFFGEPSGDELVRHLLDEAALRLRPGGLIAIQVDDEQIPDLEDYVNEDPDHPLEIKWILEDDDGEEDAILAVHA